MKNLLVLCMAALFITSYTSCTTVDSGHKGVKVYWGGKTELEYVLPEGMEVGVSWLWNSCVEYDVREKTLVKKFVFNDSRNMETSVEIALDYNLNPDQVNLIHSGITDIETKILKTLKSAGKEVVPQYTASELNLKERKTAEQALESIISKELPEFYVEFARVQITDVDIPPAIAEVAQQTAIQEGKNDLAAKKEGNNTIVTLVHDNQPHVSIQGHRIVMTLTKNNNQWEVLSIAQQFKCWSRKDGLVWGTNKCS